MPSRPAETRGEAHVAHPLAVILVVRGPCRGEHGRARPRAGRATAVVCPAAHPTIVPNGANARCAIVAGLSCDVLEEPALQPEITSVRTPIETPSSSPPKTVKSRHRHPASNTHRAAPLALSVTGGSLGDPARHVGLPGAWEAKRVNVRPAGAAVHPDRARRRIAVQARLRRSRRLAIKTVLAHTAGSSGAAGADPGCDEIGVGRQAVPEPGIASRAAGATLLLTIVSDLLPRRFLLVVQCWRAGHKGTLGRKAFAVRKD